MKALLLLLLVFVMPPGPSQQQDARRAARDRDVRQQRILVARGGTTLDFETEDDFLTPLVNGQAVASPETFGRLVSIDGSGPNQGAAIFDSDPTGPNAAGADPDLLVNLGNVLILQEEPGESVPGVFDQPDDSALGGTLAFAFPHPARPLSLDLIDLCPGPQDATVRLVDAGGNARTYHAPGGWTRDVAHHGPPGFGTLDLASLRPQRGYVATATVVQDRGYDAAAVVRLEVTFASSGALDNLRFDPQTPGTQTVTLAPSKDNTLMQSADGILSNGAGFQIFAGRLGLMGLGATRRGVLAFDVASSVPAGATITSARLTLHLSLTNTGAHDVSLHELTNDWGEGTSASGGGGGAPSTPGDATWVHTFYDTQFWDAPGGDFDEVAVATTNVLDVGFHTWTSDALTQCVQRWLDDPAANFGWLVRGDEAFFQTAHGFDSRENPAMDQRPVLTIEYTN